MDDARAANKAINDVLLGLPLTDRLTALACSIIVDESRVMYAIANMVSFVGMMTRQLPPAERLAVIWVMLDEIEKIQAKWN